MVSTRNAARLPRLQTQRATLARLSWETGWNKGLSYLCKDDQETHEDFLLIKKEGHKADIVNVAFSKVDPSFKCREGGRV